MPQPSRLLFGHSPGIARLLQLAGAMALADDPILILGERGTGKTELAEYVHHLSKPNKNFTAESVAAIPEDLLVSILAGHSRGAFTGAVEARMGLVEAARGGTLFLDELGTASPKVQAALLRYVEKRSIRRLGEDRHRDVDTRFIFATNADLETMSQRGQFRRDLRDRFGYFVLTLPPLRERRDEIIPLAEQFVAEQATAMNLGTTPTITTEARGMLMASDWPGNVRELRSLCRFAVAHCAALSDGTHITGEDLAPDFVASLGGIGRARRKPRRFVTVDQIEETLARCGNNKLAAARALNIAPSSIHRILKRAQ